MTIPVSFVRASDDHRLKTADRLEQEAQETRAKQACDWAVTFRAPDEGILPAIFIQAALTANALDSYKECALEHVDQISFEPVGSHGEGSWRIYVSFTRGGPYSGKEWKVWHEDLWKAWEEAGRAVTL